MRLSEIGRKIEIIAAKGKFNKRVFMLIKTFWDMEFQIIYI